MEITIKAHAKLKDLLNMCFVEDGGGAWSDEDVENMEIGGEDENGNEYLMDISHIREMKCYGMATPESNRVDVWIQDDADLFRVFELVGHEVAHIYLEGIEGKEFGANLNRYTKGISEKDYIASELGACVFGDITKQSAELVYEAYRQLGYKLNLLQEM